MNIDSIVVLNPDYHLKNDIDRVVMYSTKQVYHDSSIDWIGYIHPMQAMILGLFTDTKSLKEHFSDLEDHFHLPYDKITEVINSYINNPAPFYTTIGNERILFPKNVLISLDTVVKKSFHYDFNPDAFKCTKINLKADRMHRSPQSLLFMLTNKCVTQCKYCYADRNTTYKALSTNKILDIIEEAQSLFKMKKSYFSKYSYCSQCSIFDFCNEKHRRCFVKVLKAYGPQNWDFPDPRCQYAPSFMSNLKY